MSHNPYRDSLYDTMDRLQNVGHSHIQPLLGDEALLQGGGQSGLIC